MYKALTAEWKTLRLCCIVYICKMIRDALVKSSEELAINQSCSNYSQFKNGIILNLSNKP